MTLIFQIHESVAPGKLKRMMEWLSSDLPICGRIRQHHREPMRPGCLLCSIAAIRNWMLTRRRQVSCLICHGELCSALPSVVIPFTFRTTGIFFSHLYLHTGNPSPRVIPCRNFKGKTVTWVCTLTPPSLLPSELSLAGINSKDTNHLM